MMKPFSSLRALRSIACLLLLLAAFPAAGQALTQGEVLTLDRAIGIALQSQPSIAAARYTVRANEARTGESRANYYPQLNASAGYSRVSPTSSRSVTTIPSAGAGVPVTGLSTGSPGSFDQYTTNLTLNQMVYDFGKTTTQVRINRLNTESARFDLRNTQDTVILNVKQAYYNVLQSQRNRDVARQAVKQFQQHLDQAKGFFAVGTKAKFDVTKAEVDLSNAELNLIKGENQVRLARVALNNAIGVPDAPDYGLEDNLFYTRFDLPFQDALNKAYALRPDLQSLTKKKEASKESVTLARKGYYPQFNGTGSYYYTGTDFPLSNGWSYGVNVSVPVFSGFLTRYQVAEAQANLGTLSANEQSLKLDIYSQVQQGYLTLREAGERIGTSELAVRQARENVDLATGRYQAGVGGPLEVTDAVVAQANAEVAYTAALTDYKNAQAAIEKAVGVR